MIATDEESPPEGWVSAQVRDLVEVRYGKGLREENRDAGSIPVYGSNGVVGKHSTSLTNGPTIILGRKGSIGEVHYCPSSCWPIDTTYYIDNFYDIDPKFLVSALRKLNLSQLDTSTAIPGLNRDDIYEQNIPLPPLAEQRRLVIRLKQAFSLVNTTRDHLFRVPLILQRFRQAVLAAACSGRLTEDWREKHESARSSNDEKCEMWSDNPDSWGTCSVEKACAVIVDCPHSTPKWTVDGLICVRTTNFSPGYLDLSELRFVSASTYRERVSRLEPRNGDVLYSREGGILGIACMIPPNVKLCLGQRMMLMRSDQQKCEPSFLMHVLNSPIILSKVRDLTGGSASPHLNVGDVKAFEIPLPPMDEQREIVTRISSLFSLAHQIAESVCAASKSVDRLTQSILAKAFRGELVPTEAELARREGRNYEHASVLLERIKKERQQHPSSKSKTKRINNTRLVTARG